MNTKDLMKIAKAIYPDEIIKIEGDEVCFPSFLAVDGHKIVNAKFNPEKDMYQLYYCEEWSLNKKYEILIRKNQFDTYECNLFVRGLVKATEGKTRAGAILNALLEVIGND